MNAKLIDLGNGYSYSTDEMPAYCITDNQLFISLKQIKLTGKITIYRKIGMDGSAVKCVNISEKNRHPISYSVHKTVLVNPVLKTVFDDMYTDTTIGFKQEYECEHKKEKYETLPTMEDYEKLLKRIEKLEEELKIAKTLPLWRVKYED